MKHKGIVAGAVALLLLLSGVLILVMRQPSGAKEAPSQPSPRAAEETRPTPPSQPVPVDLGSVLDLQRLTDCSRGPRLASIFEQMVRIDSKTFESRRGGPIEVPGYDRPLVPTFERTRETGDNRDIRAVTADLDFAGRWHGLAVAGLRRSFYEESDSAYVSVRFSEPAERVRETLVRNGFRLPPVGELREVGGEDDAPVATGVERLDEGSALTCVTG